MKPTLQLTTLIFLIIAFGCQQPEPTDYDYREVTAEVNEVLRITSENVEKSGSDLLLGVPYLTVTDEDGFIYTYDPTQSIIFKFDDQGNFVKTIGREGRGPGEFQSVYSMTVFGGNKLFVYDFISRRATIFGSGGNIEEMRDMDFRFALDHIRPAPDGTLLFPHIQDDHIIHIFDIDKDQITKSLIHTDEILQTDERFEPELLRAQAGSAIPLSDNRIAYTPGYYNGTVYLYERSEEGWRQSDKLSGYRKIDKPFTVHETTSEPHEKAYSISIHPDGSGYLGFELHSMSMGLYPLANGRFAHLSFRDGDENKETLNLVMEIFDYEQGKLEKYAVLEELITGYPPERMPVLVDLSGFLYVVEISDEPVLRKLEVLW